MHPLHDHSDTIIDRLMWLAAPCRDQMASLVLLLYISPTNTLTSSRHHHSALSLPPLSNLHTQSSAGVRRTMASSLSVVVKRAGGAALARPLSHEVRRNFTRSAAVLGGLCVEWKADRKKGKQGRHVLGCNCTQEKVR